MGGERPLPGELSLNLEYRDRLLAASSGSSFAAPQITHCCAIVEAELRRAFPDRKPSANLIRALVVHAAVRSDRVREWMSSGTPASSAERLLRTVGYGVSNADDAALSTDGRVVLLAEDEVQERNFQLYELELPQEFIAAKGTRRIRVTLAYDPPIRGNRKDYLCRTMSVQAYRGLRQEEIVAAIAQAAGRDDGAPSLPARNRVRMDPAYTSLQWSTVQSAVFEGQRGTAFDYTPQGGEHAVFHLLVGCAHRSEAPDSTTTQRYALVVSLEHEGQFVRLYQQVRQRVEQRVRLNWG